MTKKKLKIIILGLSIGIIISIITISTTVFASDSNNLSSNNLINKVNEQISQNIVISDNKIQLKNIDDLLKNIDDSTIDKINELSISQGIDRTYTKKEFIKLYEDSISNLNKQINDGKLEMLNDGSIIESNDDSFYLQGGSTFDKRYWWGVSRWKNTSDADTWSYNLNRASILNTGVATLAGIVFGGLGSIPNALTSAYTSALSNEVSYKNSRTTRGIVADINWSLIYSVYSQ